MHGIYADPRPPTPDPRPLTAMFKTLLCDENNQFLVIEKPQAINDIVRNKGRHLWLDLDQPNEEELRLLAEEFNLHPLAIEDATRRHQRPKVDQYDNFYFVVFYAVECEEPGLAEPSPGRRGLRGTRFHSMGAGPLAAEPDQPQPDAGADNIPNVNPTSELIVLREISMFMGENYLITVHQDPIPEFDEVAKRWYRNTESMAPERNNKKQVPGARPLTPTEAQNLTHQPGDGATSLKSKAGLPDVPYRVASFDTAPDEVEESALEKRQQTSDIGILLYSLLDTIVDSYFPVIDGLVDRVEDLEQEIFERYNQAAIESIFSLKKDLLTLRKVLAPERDVLNVLTRRDLPLFEQHTLVYFQDVYDHVVRITDSIDTYRDLLSSALDSYLSMQSNRLNITVQTLTSVSIILMSVAAITGWYGMNFQYMPELNSPLGYPTVMLASAFIVALEIAFFKRKGWL